MILSEDVKVKCSSCGREHTVPKDDFECDSICVGSSGMGERYEHDFTSEVTCPQCGNIYQVKLIGSEYPLGFQESMLVDCNGCEVLTPVGMKDENDDVYRIEALLLAAASEFEGIVLDAIKGQEDMTVEYGYKLRDDEGHAYSCDLLCSSADGRKVCIDVKSYMSIEATDIVINRAVKLLAGSNTNGGLILIVSTNVAYRHRENARALGVTLVDVRDLSAWIDDEKLLERLRGNAFVRDVPISGSLPVYASFREAFEDAQSLIRTGSFEQSAVVESPVDYGILFKDRLDNIEAGRAGAREYEALCLEITKLLFGDSFLRIDSQSVQSDGLNRTDHVGILRDPKSEFWRFVHSRMNSIFVVFECKNYSEGIGQGEVLTTEKYLYPKAFRTVAIIYSRKGVSNKNAYRFIQGAMRENGCLILVLGDEDVKLMIDKWRGGEDPSDYLFIKAMDFLWDLGR